MNRGRDSRALAAAMASAAGLALVAVPAQAEDRTMDGLNNNLLNPGWGQAGSQLLRWGPARYDDGLSAMPSGMPNPRAISNAVAAQSGSTLNSRGLSDMWWQWGQFMDHDLDLTPPGVTEAAHIPVPMGDPHLDPFNTGTQSIPFMRSQYDHSTGTINARQQPNVITSYIDGSNIYGSDTTRMNALRTGTNGMMKTSAGNLLPFNTMGLDNDPGPMGGNAADFFAAGDIRANEQSGLTSMHTLFVREHNRIAQQFVDANMGLSDDEIFHRARKIVGAEIQAITYNQWLPSLLDGDRLTEYTGYDPSVNATVASEFSSALFRLGHTALSGTMLRTDAFGNVIAEGNLPLRDAFFNPSIIQDEGGIDPILRGLIAQSMQEIDNQIVDDVRNFLFGPPGAGGMDLAAINIQRGRDHGVATYNELRAAFGLSQATTFLELTGGDVDLANALASVYTSVDDVDLWVGALAEQHTYGSVGDLIGEGMIRQFTALRDGDRFFYLNDTSLLICLAELGMTLDDLQNRTLGDILIDNTGIAFTQGNVFFVPAPGALALLGMGGLFAARRRR